MRQPMSRLEAEIADLASASRLPCSCESSFAPRTTPYGILANQLRHCPMFTHQILRAPRQVVELRRRHVDSQPLVKRGEDFAEVNRPGARLFAPARGRTERLPHAHAAAGDEGAAHFRPVVAAA